MRNMEPTLSPFARRRSIEQACDVACVDKSQSNKRGHERSRRVCSDAIGRSYLFRKCAHQLCVAGWRVA
jgi:hypothetical protein